MKSRKPKRSKRTTKKSCSRKRKSICRKSKQCSWSRKGCKSKRGKGCKSKRGKGCKSKRGKKHNFKMYKPTPGLSLLVPSDDYDEGYNQELTPTVVQEIPRVASPQVGEAFNFVALDMDETLGSFGNISIILNIWTMKKLNDSTEEFPSKEVIINNYFNEGGVRSDLKQFLQNLKALKDLNKVDEVVLYTSASNTHNYIKFMIECFEEFGGTPQLFDRFISRNDVEIIRTDDGATFKDLRNVTNLDVGVRLVPQKSSIRSNNNTKGVVMVDDKTFNISQCRGGNNTCEFNTLEVDFKNLNCIGVPQYRYVVPFANTAKIIKDMTAPVIWKQGMKDSFLGQVINGLSADYKQFPPSEMNESYLQEQGVLTEVFTKIFLKFN